MIFWSDPLQISRHPSQLYQAFFEGIVLFIILNLLVIKPKPKIFISGMFLALYGSFRIFTETFRMPDSHIGFDFFRYNYKRSITFHSDGYNWFIINLPKL